MYYYKFSSHILFTSSHHLIHITVLVFLAKTNIAFTYLSNIKLTEQLTRSSSSSSGKTWMPNRERESVSFQHLSLLIIAATHSRTLLSLEVVLYWSMWITSNERESKQKWARRRNLEFPFTCVLMTRVMNGFIQY
jgi:hypothetical protein